MSLKERGGWAGAVGAVAGAAVMCALGWLGVQVFGGSGTGGSAAAARAHAATDPPPGSATPCGCDNTAVPGLASTPGGTPAAGYLQSGGSVEPGVGTGESQSVVTLRSDRALSSLTVTLRVAKGAGVASVGERASVPSGSAGASVAARGSWLVYTWKLRPGASLAPGRYTFSGAYTRGTAARDADADRYTVTAGGTGGPLSLGGGFPAGG
ncbi:hypothetical protein BIV57_22700 [Mangrovactinospora gilvigrisea]|uniref:Uncharacterized protein n=1 Tax=Mangrovactinospora gilvigrisea TaxID=1428644 RepID=A0A1J7C6G9_9ACTN|nr:hypothetical protein [Mangrovactinospora gilvigrisea]OIV35226.1 hypothetical protein BIV57_22700 [Mangrovactinospora gilvigrisea]